ncbi:piggyBac transposable element-derived protein 4-like [Saccostrea cucullata]|uniref:piggyBac transposable element-derived protein 4-like n=1 Tax=Saccostrea cuccullata TaxID=36930 RepID=UPI002ED1B879
MHWRDANVEDTGAPDPRTVAFHPERQPGIQLGRLLRYGARQFREPMDFLKLFLTEALVFSICVATNDYANMLISRGERSSYASQGNWTPLTEEELYRFLGIILYMSVVKFQTLERYWSTQALYRNNPVPGVMSRTRFQAILSFLQVTPPADIDKAEKLTRVQSLVDHVKEKSKELYQPHREIAVDERMVSSKHKFSGIRQFIKDKPIRFGIKLWVVACNMSGYTYDFFVYLGKKNTIFTERAKGLGYNVTLRLCESLFDQGYRLFTDCFYTSLALGKELFARKLYLVGVLKSNSLSIPDELRDVKIWERVATRGDFRWQRVDEFVFVQWKDCKVVTFMSPLHQGSATTVCERTMKSRLTWNKKQLVQPVVANDYNKCMGAVDLSNQFTNKYPSYIRTQYHWWKVLFFHLLDIMVVNSYILFQEFRKSHESQITNCSSGFGQLEFRESLALSLMGLNEKSVSKESVIQCIPEFLEKRKDCVFCNAEAILLNKKSPSYKTLVFCPSCQVPLCLSSDRNCFKKWHSKEGEDVRKSADLSCKKRKL